MVAPVYLRKRNRTRRIRVHWCPFVVSFLHGYGLRKEAHAKVAKVAKVDGTGAIRNKSPPAHKDDRHQISRSVWTALKLASGLEDLDSLKAPASWDAVQTLRACPPPRC